MAEGRRFIVTTARLATATALSIVSAGLAGAAPPERHDDGPTLPIESFLAERQPENSRADLVSDLATVYPVATPGLRRSTLRRTARLPQAYARWLTQPMALIADDAPSRRWLTQQGDALRTLGVAILVVRVQSADRMRALREHRAALAMSPALVPELAHALRAVGAAIYPLVILTDGSLQQDVRGLALRDAGGRP